MSASLEQKLKIALDEARLHILGVQVLLGFQFQSAFQDRFGDLPELSQNLNLVALSLLITSCAFLIAPSMRSRIVERGTVTPQLIWFTTILVGLALPPLAAALGLATYTMITLHFGTAAGAITGAGLTLLALLLWFGIAITMGLFNNQPDGASAEQTPVSVRIEHLLTEARLILPGAQALFGFQLLIMFTAGFDALPSAAKLAHTVALCLTAITICLLITPAALHRLSYNGENSPRFLRSASPFLVVAPAFLAAGISVDFGVVFLKVTGSPSLAMVGFTVGLGVLFGLWYGMPLLQRSRQQTKRDPSSSSN